MAEQKVSGQQYRNLHGFIENDDNMDMHIIEQICGDIINDAENKLDLNYTSEEYSRTLLIHAIEKDSIAIVKDLLDAGADPFTNDYYGNENAFDAAIKNDSDEVLTLMMSTRAIDYNEYIKKAVKKGAFECVRILLDAGAEKTEKLAKLVYKWGCGIDLFPEFEYLSKENTWRVRRAKCEHALSLIVSSPSKQRHVYNDVDSWSSQEYNLRLQKINDFKKMLYVPKRYTRNRGTGIYYDKTINTILGVNTNDIVVEITYYKRLIRRMDIILNENDMLNSDKTAYFLFLTENQQFIEEAMKQTSRQTSDKTLRTSIKKAKNRVRNIIQTHIYELQLQYYIMKLRYANISELIDLIPANQSKYIQNLAWIDFLLATVDKQHFMPVTDQYIAVLRKLLSVLKCSSHEIYFNARINPYKAEHYIGREHYIWMLPIPHKARPFVFKRLSDIPIYRKKFSQAWIYLRELFPEDAIWSDDQITLYKLMRAVGMGIRVQFKPIRMRFPYSYDGTVYECPYVDSDGNAFNNCVNPMRCVHKKCKSHIHNGMRFVNRKFICNYQGCTRKSDECELLSKTQMEKIFKTRAQIQALREELKTDDVERKVQEITGAGALRIAEIKQAIAERQAELEKRIKEAEENLKQKQDRYAEPINDMLLKKDTLKRQKEEADRNSRQVRRRLDASKQKRLHDIIGTLRF